MVDLVYGLGVLTLVSLTALLVGHRLACRTAPRVSGALALVVLTLVVWFALAWHGRLGLSRWMPWSNAIVLTNGIPVGASFLLGLVAGQTAVPPWRRLSVGSLLALLALYVALFDVLAPAPRPRTTPQFVDGFCTQTTTASCSPCCAVSLLMEHQIQTSEAEMMRLCLTRVSGTPELGLYRGLKLKTRGTPYDVELLQGGLAALRAPAATPALLLVDSAAAYSPAGPLWFPRRPDHALVVYGFSAPDRLDLGDPSVGRTAWDVEQLQRCWRGVGLRLVRRSPTAAK